MALALAILSSLCFGIALVTGRVGLRTLDARSGAAISIPTATLLFITAAPFAFDLLQFDVRAVLLFAIACAVAACDPDPALPEVRVDEAPVAALVSSPRRPLAAEAYIGDEYADVQRALAVEPGEAA